MIKHSLQEVIVPDVPWYVSNFWWIGTIIVILSIFVFISTIVFISVNYGTGAKGFWSYTASIVSTVLIITGSIVAFVIHHDMKQEWHKAAAEVLTVYNVTPYQLEKTHLMSMVTKDKIQMSIFPQDWIVHPTTGEYVKDYRVIISDGYVVSVSGDEGGKLKEAIRNGY